MIGFIPISKERIVTSTILQEHANWKKQQSLKKISLNLLQHLKSFGLEKHLYEVNCNIAGPLFDSILKSMKGISGWSVDDVYYWLLSLNFLNDRIAKLFKENWIDGNIFMKLDIENQNLYQELGLNETQSILLLTIRNGWLHKWEGESLNENYVSRNFEELLETRDNTIDDIKRASIYGALIVLGTKVSRIDDIDCGIQRVGFQNECLILQKQIVSNGMKYNPTSNSFVIDIDSDMFQVGRSLGNNLIIGGSLHLDKTNRIGSSVSKFACRIVCQRSPPYKCYLYASGFDNDKKIYRGDKFKMLSPPNDSSLDELTTFGLKLWIPNLKEWIEISVLGNCYSIRETKDNLGKQLGSPYSNELVDGSIIDLHGVSILFRGPQHLQSLSCKNNRHYIDEINQLKIQCPVQLHTLEFSYSDAHSRSIEEFRKLDSFYLPSQSYAIPVISKNQSNENKTPYIFPACGHVFGYHSGLVNKSCPLCRKSGTFVPLAIEFENLLSDRRPTHVFNPCGHIAAKYICELFSNIPMFLYGKEGEIIGSCLKCPFCYNNLNDFQYDGGPFNRIIFQTESGVNWDSDSDRSPSLSMESEAVNNDENITAIIEEYPSNREGSKTELERVTICEIL